MLGEILGAVGSIAGGILGNKSAEKAAKRNEAVQREFAQNSLQWKSADAEKAGISKVFAMGAPTQSFTPSSVGGNFDFLGSAGQNIGRAISANQTPAGQAGAIPRAAQAVQLEGLQLDNEFKRAQIASLNKNLLQAGQPPGVPDPSTSYAMPGQPVSGDVTRSTKLDAIGPHTGLVPGSTPENMLVQTGSGKYTPMLAPGTQEALESMGWLAQRQAEMRNIVYPTFSSSYRPGAFKNPPAGYHSRYNPLTGEYKFKKTKPYHNPRSR